MMLNKTKIVATLGPALDKLFTWNGQQFKIEDVNQFLKQIANVIDAGCRIFRFNLSHNKFEDHIFRAKVLRDFFEKSLTSAALMFDTKGPEIRVGVLQKDDPSLNELHKDDVVTIHSNLNNHVGNAKEFSVYDSSKTYNLAKDLKKNNIIFIEDGKLVLQVTLVNELEGYVKAKVLSDKYLLKDNKRLNIKDGKYSMPFLSEFDIKSIQLACDLEIDFLALSFVRNKKDLVQVKSLINKYMPDSEIKLVSKIETREALENLDDIIKNSDGIMIARGDLALDIGYEKIAYYEQIIAKTCVKHKKPFIVATQMLDSLERNLLPTRAEVTDLYFAVENEADATMLSGESAQGIDPLNAIEVMQQVLVYDESVLLKNKLNNKYPLAYKDQYLHIKNELLNKNKKYLVLESKDTDFLIYLSQLRLDVVILVVCDDPRIFNKLLLHFGLYFVTKQQLKALNLNAREAIIL